MMRHNFTVGLNFCVKGVGCCPIVVCVVFMECVACLFLPLQLSEKCSSVTNIQSASSTAGIFRSLLWIESGNDEELS